MSHARRIVVLLSIIILVCCTVSIVGLAIWNWGSNSGRLELPSGVVGKYADFGEVLDLQELRRYDKGKSPRVILGKKSWPYDVFVISIEESGAAELSYSDIICDQTQNQKRAVWKHVKIVASNPALWKRLVSNILNSPFFVNYDVYIGKPEETGLEGDYTVALELDGHVKKVVYMHFLPTDIASLFTLVEREVTSRNADLIADAPIVDRKTIRHQLQIVY